MSLNRDLIGPKIASPVKHVVGNRVPNLNCVRFSRVIGLLFLRCVLAEMIWLAFSCLKIEMLRLVVILQVQPRVLPCLDKLNLIYINAQNINQFIETFKISVLN